LCIAVTTAVFQSSGISPSLNEASNIFFRGSAIYQRINLLLKNYTSTNGSFE